MKINETIDGSLKDTIQLKTVDNSLEYSQMFDALKDTPKDFQTKLIDALNSLSQTMGVAPEEAFNQVLCASKDDNQDVNKKMYNWWRGFFEVLGKVSDGKVPKDRESEYNQKIDDLMAEIMKSGDAESTEDEVVMEAEDDLGYQQANKSDEDEMLKDFEFAAQHIGEVANKVKDIVNFVNPYCEKTFNEVDNIMKNTANERGDSEWISMNDLVGKEYGESDDDETHFEPKFKVGDKVTWIDPEYPDEPSTGWEVVDAPEDDGVVDPDDIYVIVNNETGSEAQVLGSELRPSDVMMEAKVTVDANDVWDVLDLLDNDIAKKELTDLINSHVRTEAEIMDAIDELSGEVVSKDQLNTLLSGQMATLVDYLGLDVERYEDSGEFVEVGKPTSVELEGTDWKDHEEDISADDLADSIYDWGIKNSNEDFDIQEADAVDGSTIELTIGGKDAKQIEDKVNNALIYNAKNWEVLSVNEEEDEVFIVKLEKTEGNNDEVTLEDSTDEQKPEEVKGGEKKFKKDGETKTLVTGSDKQKVNEMTIEQEIDNPWNLLELLWGQGQENFRDLLESELIDNDTIMMMLEDMELKNLTSINDAFAYDFPAMLDAFGLDGEAWSKDLEIKRKDDDSED